MIYYYLFTGEEDSNPVSEHSLSRVGSMPYITGSDFTQLIFIGMYFHDGIDYIVHVTLFCQQGT